MDAGRQIYYGYSQVIVIDDRALMGSCMSRIILLYFKRKGENL
jgi:hypothetical protein